jgi:hypothetical protein
VKAYNRQQLSLLHLQLLHKAHDIEHHLRPNHLVLLVEAALQHAVLHARTEIEDRVLLALFKTLSTSTSV